MRIEIVLALLLAPFAASAIYVRIPPKFRAKLFWRIAFAVLVFGACGALYSLLRTGTLGEPPFGD